MILVCVCVCVCVSMTQRASVSVCLCVGISRRRNVGTSGCRDVNLLVGGLVCVSCLFVNLSVYWCLCLLAGVVCKN